MLDGVSGRVRVTADPGAREVSGSFQRADGRPALVRAGGGQGKGGILTVSCADEGGAPQPCDGDLVVVVPEHTGLRLRQTSGEADVDGLGGEEVSLTGSSLRLTTHALHPAHADVTLTSGSADLGFSAAPGDLDLHATSASVAVRLPQVDGGYAVSTNVTSADVQVQVPRDDSASHHVALTVTSGSLALQNA